MSSIHRLDRTLVSFAAAFIVALLLMPSGCFAFDYAQITGCNATGAHIKDYDKAIKLDVTEFGADSTGKEDSWKAIQYALNYAIDNASDDVQVKVIIPEGTYSISHCLKIYSNTWLYMEGATIRRDYDNGRMLWNAQQGRRGGYDDDRNIIIEGGCFDGNATVRSTDFSNIRLGHCNNVWIKNVEIKNNYNGHHLEVGGVKNLTVEDCDFHGYSGSSVKEALQLDVMNNANLFNSYAPYDDSACDNIVIKNNTFTDLMRGVGSHSAVFGVYYTNILITGNTFENMYDCAVIMQNYKNCIIESNVMKDVGCGIDFMNMAPAEYNRYFIPVNGLEGIYDRIDNNANTVIRKNSISTIVTSYRPDPVGVQLYGRVLRSSYYPEYDYKVEGVKVSENKIKTAGSGITLNDTVGVQVNSNVVAYDTSGKTSEANLIDVRASGECSLTSNHTNGGDEYCAIYAGGCSDIDISSNDCVNSGAAGICVSLNTSSATVSSNTVDSCGSNGIAIAKQADAQVSSNTVTNCGEDGIFFSGATGNATGNTVSSSAYHGIELSSTGEAEVSGNTLSYNGGAGLCVKADSTAVIGDNIYEGNASGGAVPSGGYVSPKAAEGYVCDGVYQDHVQLSWQPVSESDSYLILRRLEGEDRFIETAEVNSTSFVDMGLPSKTGYEYLVQTVKYIGDKRYNGKQTDVISVRTKAGLSDCECDLPKVMKYTGKKIEPGFNIYLDGAKLVPEVDYNVRFYNNIAVGTATVAVTGNGQYVGYREFTFEISISEGDTSDPISDSLRSFSAGAAENCIVMVSGDKDQPATRRSASSSILDTIDQAKQSTGIMINARRVKGSGGYASYGLWI